MHKLGKCAFSHLIWISQGMFSACTWENTCFHSFRGWFEKNLSFLVSSRKSFHLKSCWERLHQSISQLIQSKGEENLSYSFLPLLCFSWRPLLRQQDIRYPTWQTKNSVSPLSFLSSCFQWGSLFFLYDWNNYPDKAKDWGRCSP